MMISTAQQYELAPENFRNVSGKMHRELAVERLRDLYSMLYGVPEEKLDLGTWATSGKVPSQIRSACGTTACAVGWACLYPNFKKQGLGIRTFRNKNAGSFPIFRDGGNWIAVEDFFGLTEHEARRLFMGYGTGVNAKRMVMRAIRKQLLDMKAISVDRFEELATWETENIKDAA